MKNWREKKTSEKLIESLVQLKENDVLRIAKEKIKSGEEPVKVLEAMRRGMEKIGSKYEKGEYFIAELIMSAEIFKEVMEIVKPKLSKDDLKPLGKLVIGTVQGDVHDIGKNIIATLLEANGFEVYDLGVDVAPESFVKKIKETNSKIVCMSGLLTASFEGMKKTVDAITETGLRNKVKIVVGGNPVGERIAKYVGADAWANNATEGVRIIKGWVSK